MRSPERVVFSYGLMMSFEVSAKHCPYAEFLGRARIHDWRYAIAGVSGTATIEQSPGSMVHGILWGLSEEDVINLNYYEGLYLGRSFRLAVEIFDERDRRRIGVTYISFDRTLGKPRPGFQEAVVEAAIRRALPDFYIAELKRWVHG